MPRIMNVSPYGDLDVPLLGRVVEAGAVAEVTEEQAKVLLEQAENFAPVNPPTDETPAQPDNTEKEQS